ncbi:hypothetical protein [Rhodovulum sulfidophilum]|nr:hypothetical protein [Rhodovulum sulfidophilum]
MEYWFSVERGPSGEHLVSFARYSYAVPVLLLTMADLLVLEDDDG